ncbi:MAG: TetR/AcrR family transcriptional regulator C-terminal domain-containing protein [Lachnospiraceae bacterium]
MKYQIASLNTKRALAETLKSIMRKKSFSKITVSEIISECGVNRKTFYYHFSDIYDLLKWTFENEAIEIVKHFNLVIDYKEAILFVMDYIEENDYILNCAYDSIGRDEMKRFFFHDFFELVSTIIDSAEQELDKYLDEKYKVFLCHFYTEALAGILIDWIKNRDDRNRDEVADHLVTTIRNSLRGILQ